MPRLQLVEVIVNEKYEIRVNLLWSPWFNQKHQYVMMTMMTINVIMMMVVMIIMIMIIMLKPEPKDGHGEAKSGHRACGVRGS